MVALLPLTYFSSFPPLSSPSWAQVARPTSSAAVAGAGLPQAAGAALGDAATGALAAAAGVTGAGGDDLVPDAAVDAGDAATAASAAVAGLGMPQDPPAPARPPPFLLSSTGPALCQWVRACRTPPARAWEVQPSVLCP
jgi:hypothetical protein